MIKIKESPPFPLALAAEAAEAIFRALYYYFRNYLETNMTPAEKRKFLRLDSLHLLDYLVIDTDGNQGEYSMGRTLDVSVNGIKMETVHAIPAQSKLIITLGIEENLVDITGSTIHTHHEESRYISGIEFNKVSSKDRAILRRYVDEFQARKEALLRRNDFPPLHAKAI